MAKKISITILILLVVMTVFYWLRPRSRFLLTALPPSNLYSPIERQKITLKEKSSSFSLQLTHEYVGTYLVGVHIEKSPPFGTPIESSAVLSLSVRDDDLLVFEKKFARWASRFGGAGRKESGVILGYYRVPDDIPLGVTTQAILSIDSPDPTFEEKYGYIEFFIRRKSDQ